MGCHQLWLTMWLTTWLTSWLASESSYFFIKHLLLPPQSLSDISYQFCVNQCNERPWQGLTTNHIVNQLASVKLYWLRQFKPVFHQIFCYCRHQKVARIPFTLKSDRLTYPSSCELWATAVILIKLIFVNIDNEVNYFVILCDGLSLNMLCRHH